MYDILNTNGLGKDYFEGYTYSPSTTSNQTGVFFSRVVESDTDDYFEAQVNINVASGTPTANDQAFFYGYKLIT